MPRPKNSEPHTTWKLSIPVSISAQVEHLIMDPISGKPGYAKRSHLVTALLRRYLREINFNPQSPPITQDQIKSLHGGNERSEGTGTK